MAGWICEACNTSAGDGWGACHACGELRPVDDRWPTVSTLVLLYPGATQVEAAPRYRAHADRLAAVGYLAIATSWGDERPGAGVALFAAHVEEAFRVGSLLVTYRRSTTA